MTGNDSHEMFFRFRPNIRFRIIQLEQLVGVIRPESFYLTCSFQTHPASFSETLCSSSVILDLDAKRLNS